MDEILNTIMGRIPRPSNPFASRRWKTFSVADWNAAEMEKGGIVEWREWKDKGNDLFKEKDYAGARAMYGKARLLALGPYRSGAVKAWFDALQAAPAPRLDHQRGVGARAGGDAEGPHGVVGRRIARTAQGRSSRRGCAPCSRTGGV